LVIKKAEISIAANAIEDLNLALSVGRCDLPLQRDNETGFPVSNSWSHDEMGCETPPGLGASPKRAPGKQQ
jgi:hypothetical protein